MTKSSVIMIFIFVPFVLFVANLYAQNPTTVALKRFEIIRVDQADINCVPNDLRQIFADPVPDSELVSGLSEVTKRVGFTARLPKSDRTPQFGVVAPIGKELKISIG